MGTSKILVTGATGVVGRRLVPILVREGHSVVAMGHGSRSREALERMGAAPIEADFADPGSLRRAVRGCDAVVNLATHMPASSTELLHRSSWTENDAIRSRGSSNLVDAALAEGAARFIQESFALAGEVLDVEEVPAPAPATAKLAEKIKKGKRPSIPIARTAGSTNPFPCARSGTTVRFSTPKPRRPASRRPAASASSCASARFTGRIRGS